MILQAFPEHFKILPWQTKSILIIILYPFTSLQTLIFQAFRRFFHFFTPNSRKSTVQTLANFLCHGNITASTFCPGLLHIIFSAPLPDKLMFHPDSSVYKIQTAFRQAAKLADTHTCS